MIISCDGKKLTDIFSSEKRKYIMSRVKSKNTKPELVVRFLLHKCGVRRYTKNSTKLPGCPDILIQKSKKVIFIHGCFWHRHNECKHSGIPKSNEVFWNTKFNRNVVRDKTNIEKLENMGYRILIIWECEIKTKNFVNLSQKISEFIQQ